MKTTLTDEEIRNNILAEIHNRLAEISTYLKTGLALFAKLNHDDINILDESHVKHISLNTTYMDCNNYNSYGPDEEIGFSSDKGLYTVMNPYGNKTLYPLGDFERTAPIDEETGAFINNTQED